MSLTTDGLRQPICHSDPNREKHSDEMIRVASQWEDLSMSQTMRSMSAAMVAMLAVALVVETAAAQKPRNSIERRLRPNGGFWENSSSSQRSYTPSRSSSWQPQFNFLSRSSSGLSNGAAVVRSQPTMRYMSPQPSAVVSRNYIAQPTAIVNNAQPAVVVPTTNADAAVRNTTNAPPVIQATPPNGVYINQVIQPCVPANPSR